MKSVLSCALLMIAFVSSVASAAVATPPVAQSCDSKIEKGFIHIKKGTGAEARNPTLEELFDAFNSTKTLIGDLKWEEGRKHQPLLYIEVPGKEAVYYDFQSVPKKGKGDPRCKDQKVTGYECRLEQLRRDELTAGLPNGIKTGVQIRIPETDLDLVARVSRAFGCGEVLEESGQPVLPAQTSPPVTKSAAKKVGKPVPSVKVDQPTDETGPLVGGKPKANVIPAIQLQAVPAGKPTAK